MKPVTGEAVRLYRGILRVCRSFPDPTVKKKMQHNAREIFEVRRHVKDEATRERLVQSGFTSLDGLRAVVAKPKLLEGLILR